jgi:hypothetical protein
MELVHEFEGSIDVGCDNACAEAVGEGVGSSNNFLFSAPLEDAHHRAKDLLSCDSHFVFDVGEDGWLDEITFFSPSCATNCNIGSLFLTLLDVPENLFKLLLADDCTLSCARIKRVSNFDVLGNLDAFLNELVVNALVNESSRACDATLAAITEENTGLFSS